MSQNHRKRKYRAAHHRDETSHPRASSPQEFQFLGHHESYQNNEVGTSTGLSEVDPLRALYIQAHEADIVRGANAKIMAQSLEVVEYQTINGVRDAVTVVPQTGSALIQWGDSSAVNPLEDTDEDAIPLMKERIHRTMWIDRYDARLLLDTLPSVQASAQPASPSGWSDISSDVEDTFFFTPDEAEDYHREKRRRLLEQTREDRLKARMIEDGADEEPEEEDDAWGGSDEEPDDTQRELMTRTASHLLSSPNPAQLEMRILANHGGDRRFAFLRGRWKQAWNLAKAKARMSKNKEGSIKPAALGVLADYGSDSDSESEKNELKDAAKENTSTTMIPILDQVATMPDTAADDEATKEMRRQRLKEWAEKRRATKEAAG